MNEPDKLSLDRIKRAHPLLREELHHIFLEMNANLQGRAKPRLAYVLRTFAEQNALYAQGRKILEEVNSLRAKAGMPPIAAVENSRRVTNAPAGLSIHNYGMAFDIVLLVDRNGNGRFSSASWETNVDFDGDGVADWLECVEIAKRYGWTWGGDWKWKDMPHFEKTYGYKPSDLLAKYKAGEKDENGYIIL